MRKITKESIEAFLNFKAYKKDNTEVHIQPLTEGNIVASLYLYGNKIAGYISDTKQLYISNCGYFTNTTKERLNALPNVSIYQKKEFGF